MKDVNGMSVVDRLLRAHGLIGADEVWVHGMWTVDKWIRCVKAKLAGKKLVRMTHGSLSPIYLEKQSKWKKRLVKPIERWLFAISDRMVVTGEWEVEWARRWGYRGRVEGIDLKRFFKLGGGRDENIASTGEAAREGTRRTLHVLYLGRRHPLKGVEYLEQAVEAAREGTRRTGRGIELRIVCDHVGEELEKDWAWCDVLCLPTLSENFGLVVAEALERGKRVITTDGAPAWSDLNPDRGIYLTGYVAGSDADRVRLLRDALVRSGGMV